MVRATPRNPFVTVAIAAVILASPDTGEAGEFTFSFHEASGSGTANLFDGGPPVSRSGDTVVPTNPDMGFFAIDVTRPGSLGASANASGRSEIGVLDDRMGIMVRLDVAYVPSLFGGGDNPGSMAEGSLSSVIEFVLPADELIWAYQLDIRETIRFKGSTSVLFENVTQSEVLLDATAAIFPPIETTLSGNTGDLMRVTTMMSGSGSTKPSSKNQYTPTLDMVFIIPEPATLSLLALGGYLASRPRRRGSLQSS